MRQYFDLDTEKFVTQSGYQSSSTGFERKVASGGNLEIEFSRNGEAEDLPVAAQVRFGLKEAGKYDGSVIALAETGDFTKVADTTGLYAAPLDLNTAAIKALLNVNEDDTDDIAEVVVMGQMDWRLTGSGNWSKSPTLSVKLNNSVLMDTDGMEVDPVPPYPLAQEIIDAIEVTAAVPASNTFTLTGEPVHNETITIMGVEITWVNQATQPVVPTGDNIIYFSPALSLGDYVTVLADFFRGDTVTSVAGMQVINPSMAVVVTAVASFSGGDGTVLVTHAIAGAAGNAVDTTEAMANGSWGAATLEGGADAIYINGDSLVADFAQTRTDGKKAIARTNIGAASQADLDDVASRMGAEPIDVLKDYAEGEHVFAEGASWRIAAGGAAAGETPTSDPAKFEAQGGDGDKAKLDAIGAPVTVADAAGRLGIVDGVVGVTEVIQDDDVLAEKYILYKLIAADATLPASWMGLPYTTAEDGTITVVMQLADFRGIVPDLNDLGQAAGFPTFGDGVATNGKKLALRQDVRRLNPEGMMRVVTTNLTDIGITLKHDGTDSSTGVCRMPDSGAVDYTAVAADTNNSSVVAHKSGAPQTIHCWSAQSSTSGRFGNLTSINAAIKNIEQCDVVGLGELTSLLVNSNPLSHLNLEGCDKLDNINTSNTQIKSLDLSGKSILTSFIYNDGELEYVDLTGCVALSIIYVANNSLKTLDISDCAAATDLQAGDNNLVAILANGVDLSAEYYGEGSNIANNNLSFEALVIFLESLATTTTGTIGYGGNPGSAAFETYLATADDKGYIWTND